MSTYSLVQDVIDRCSQDLRLQLQSTVGATGQPILIDYTDRISKQILRYSRWDFTKSEPQHFLTVKGQTDYWIGPAGAEAPGTVDTGLGLIDVGYIQKNSVRDISNSRPLFSLAASPIGNQFNFQSGQVRGGRPSNYWQDHNDVNIIHLYPGPNNDSSFRPVPSSPICTAVAGGSLPLRSYYVVLTFVDSAGLESSGSALSVVRTIPANQLLSVATPTLVFNQASTGVIYNQYNVYVGTAEGSETLQNVSPLNMGSNYTEVVGGITTTGAKVPQTNSLTPIGGFVIEFRYFKSRITLNEVDQSIQIPDDYIDVVVNGVSALGWKLLSRMDDAQACEQLFKAGLVQMVWDKNLFPGTDFIRPDPATYVNSQNLGQIWPADSN